MSGIKIRAQADYLLTEANIEVPRRADNGELDECPLNRLDSMMQAMGATGRIVAQYNQGRLMGINIEQKAKVRNGISEEVRRLSGVDTTEINGESRY